MIDTINCFFVIFIQEMPMIKYCQLTKFDKPLCQFDLFRTFKPIVKNCNGIFIIQYGNEKEFYVHRLCDNIIVRYMMKTEAYKFYEFTVLRSLVLKIIKQDLAIWSNSQQVHEIYHGKIQYKLLDNMWRIILDLNFGVTRANTYLLANVTQNTYIDARDSENSLLIRITYLIQMILGKRAATLFIRRMITAKV